MIEDDSGQDAQLSALAVNTDDFTLRRQRQINQKAGWQSLFPAKFIVNRVALIGGGPSINDYVDVIQELRADGVFVCTMNGSHDWCLQNQIFPDGFVMVDARVQNRRFTARPLPGVKYMMADHCHWQALASLPRESTYLWSREAIKGGSTVMLCAPALLRQLGASEFHFFGFDSCLTADNRHHGYEQPENNADEVLTILVDDVEFRTTRWMVQQAEEFLELASDWGAIKVYGDGMIATLLRQDD